MKKILSIIGLSLFCISASFAKDKSVSFGNLKDQDVVTSPVHVEMNVNGLTVAPAGTMTENTGHFHLIVDAPPVKKGEVVPADEKHIHFGKGQTSTELPLTPGNHTLTVQFADGAHRSYGDALSSTIRLNVSK